MSDGSAGFRAHAALSFEIADVLSDRQAAEQVRAAAERYLRRAEELEARERQGPLAASSVMRLAMTSRTSEG
jgi:hypothetical protein